MKHTSLSILAALAPLMGGIAAPVSAESPADQLERGIYKEETVGNLEAAIEIYLAVVDSQTATRHTQAEAQLRLGLCYLKLGRKAEARTVLQRLVDTFPDQDEFVQQGRRQLATCDVAQDLSLGLEPWRDGEVLTYDGRLPGGMKIGTLATSVRSDRVADQDVWRFQIRRFITTMRNNQGVSEAVTVRDTNAPLQGYFHHKLLGNVDLTYKPDAVHIKHDGPEVETDKVIGLEGAVFDNESVLHMSRRLPLAVGYETTLPIMVSFTHSVMTTDMSVEALETITVPAGTFECFKVVYSIGETTWYSNDANRYPVQIQAEGVTFQLSDIGQRPTGSEGSFVDETYGAAVTLPVGWLASPLMERNDVQVVLLLDPGMKSKSTIELGLTDPARAATLERRVERELEGVRSKLKDYMLQMRQDLTIDGHPAVRFTGTYERDDTEMIQDRAYVVLPDRWIEFIFRVPAKDYPEMRDDLTRIIESYRIPS